MVYIFWQICDVTKPQNKAVGKFRVGINIYLSYSELIQELFKEINRLGEELMAAQTNLEIAEKKLSTLASSNSSLDAFLCHMIVPCFSCYE